MIVNRKNKDKIWRNLEGYTSRLSGLCYATHSVNDHRHRLYDRSIRSFWDLNDKDFNNFKEV